jgi:hypothetical protein
MGFSSPAPLFQAEIMEPERLAQKGASALAPHRLGAACPAAPPLAYPL